MLLLSKLGVGDKFRVAYPDQKSLNGRTMDRSEVFKITKVYPQTPHLVISIREANPADGIYSLGPMTPVLLPGEYNPTKEDVLRFLRPKGRTRVLEYRLLWDGITPLKGIVTPQASAVLRTMLVHKRPTFTPKELKEVLEKHFEEFLGRPSLSGGYSVFLFYRRYLISKGLVEERTERVISRSEREANIIGD